MTREKAFELINAERKYQDEVRPARYGEHKPDTAKSQEAFLIYIEAQLQEAKKAAYHVKPSDIQDHVRKIAALCVASMEIFGAPSRTMDF